MSLPPTASVAWLCPHSSFVYSCPDTRLVGSLVLPAVRHSTAPFATTTSHLRFALPEPLPGPQPPTTSRFQWPNRRSPAAESNSELPQPTRYGGHASLSHGRGSPAVCWTAPAYWRRLFSLAPQIRPRPH